MFICAASIICKAPFILISTGTPTEENHNLFSICFFFVLFCFSQILTFHRKLRENREPSYLVLSTTSTNIQTFICAVLHHVYTYKHLCVLGKQKYTMAVWYNVYITKKLLSFLTEARRGVPGKHCLPKACFFSFLIFPLKSNIVKKYSHEV